MPSPDLTPYIQLSLVDYDPQDIFDIFLATVQRNLSEQYEPREGHIEMVLGEAVSQAVAESIFTVNRLPDAITEVLLRLHGHERDTGEPPIVDLKFTLNTAQGYTIPQGTTVVFEAMNNMGSVVVSLVDDLIIEDGQTQGVGLAQGTTNTSAINGLPINTQGELLDSIIFVDSVVTNSVAIDGRDPEDDLTFLSRGVQQFGRLNSALTVRKHFELASMDKSYVERAYAIDNYNPANDLDGNGPIGNDPGHMTVAVYGANQNVSTDDKADLLATLKAQAVANLAIHIIDPVITNFTVAVTVVLDDDADQAAVVSDIGIMVKAFYDPMTWEWGGVIRRNMLISLITEVPGVAFVKTLTTPATDTTLAGVANLVKATVVNVTVDAS